MRLAELPAPALAAVVDALGWDDRVALGRTCAVLRRAVYRDAPHEWALDDADVADAHAAARLAIRHARNPAFVLVCVDTAGHDFPGDELARAIALHADTVRVVCSHVEPVAVPARLPAARELTGVTSLPEAPLLESLVLVRRAAAGAVGDWRAAMRAYPRLSYAAFVALPLDDVAAVFAAAPPSVRVLRVNTDARRGFFDPADPADAVADVLGILRAAAACRAQAVHTSVCTWADVDPEAARAAAGGTSADVQGSSGRVVVRGGAAFRDPW